MRPYNTRKASSLRSAGDQPRVAARRAPTRSLGWIDQPETYDRRYALHGAAPGSSEFPSFLPCRRRRTDLGCVCSPHCRHPTSSWVARPWHTPVCHQGERGRAAGMIAARVTPPLPRRWGNVIVRALHGMGGRARGPAAAGQQRLAESCSGVSGWAVAFHYTRFPIRTGQSISSCGTPPRGLPGYSSPPAHGWGRFHQPRLRAATQGKEGQAGLLLLLLRPPARVGTLSGWRRSSCVYAMRCGARALKLSLGPHAAVAIPVLGRSEYWVATQTTESR